MEKSGVEFPNIDFHMHTHFSDGENSIKEMIESCIERGIKKIAISDHLGIYGEFLNAPTINRNKKTLPDYIRTIKKLRKKYATRYNNKISLSKNLNIKDEDIKDKNVNYADMIEVFISAEISSDLPRWNYIIDDEDNLLLQNLSNFSFFLIESIYIYDPIETALNMRKMLDYLKHPEIPVILAHPNFLTMKKETFMKLIGSNIGIELNSSKFGRGDEAGFLELYGALNEEQKEGLMISIGSDAHWAEDAGDISYLKYFVEKNDLVYAVKNLLTKLL